MEDIQGGVNLVSVFRNYETELAQLKQEIQSITLQNKEYMKNIKAVTDENKQLQSEIQELIEEQLTKISDHVGSADEGLVRNLQTQLEFAHNERDAAIQMNKETMQLLDNIRKQQATDNNQSRNHFPNETKLRVDTLEEANLQMQMLIESLQQENKTLSYTTSEQIKELKTIHEQSRDTKQKLIECVRKQEEDKKMIISLRARLDDLRSENSELKVESNEMNVRNQQLQTSLTQAEGKLAHALQTITESHTETDNLKIQLVALEKLNTGIESKEMGYLMQIRQSAQLLDDALLSRDSALSKVEQSKNDLEKASSAMEALVREVADRVKSEVDKVKTQCNNNIRRLMDEVELLELENTNLHSEAERAKRDKRSVEEEMEVLRHQCSDAREKRAVEELQRRTIHAERARDDLLITVEKLEDRMKKLKRETNDDRSQLLSTNQKLDNRVKRLERENDENRHERFQLLESINQCKSENQKLEEYARSARLTAAKEFSAVKENLIKEKKQLSVKLSCLDSNHQDTMRKLHKMLSDQQRVASRWKDECKRSSELYEDKVKSLQLQLTKTRRKCEDLINKFKIAPITINEDAARLEEENRNLRSDLHQSHYETLSLAHKLSNAQSMRNSIALHDLQ